MPDFCTTAVEGTTLPDEHSTKRIATIQSCYIPWKGFFDLISRCDEYVILDGAQYAKRHWHNRNVIKTANGLLWLTIPVRTKSRFTQPIDEVEIARPWAETHWRSIATAYRKAPYFSEFAPIIRKAYVEAEREQLLSRVNEIFFRCLMTILEISTNIRRDSEYAPDGARSERLLNVCRSAGATHYLSGPSARDYLNEQIFGDKNIQVEWMSYGPYLEYTQLHGPFEHNVSVLDVIFHTGRKAPRFIKPAPQADKVAQ